MHLTFTLVNCFVQFFFHLDDCKERMFLKCRLHRFTCCLVRRLRQAALASSSTQSRNPAMQGCHSNHRSSCTGAPAETVESLAACPSTLCVSITPSCFLWEMKSSFLVDIRNYKTNDNILELRGFRWIVIICDTELSVMILQN